MSEQQNSSTRPADPGDDDPDALDDQAAELDEDVAAPDDSEPEPAPADDSIDTDAGHGLGYSGVCRGGPFNGRTVVSRFPRGFWLTDRPNGRAWVYDFDGAEVFTCRMTDPVVLDEDGLAGAAEASDYDVIAFDDPASAQEVHR